MAITSFWTTKNGWVTKTFFKNQKVTRLGGVGKEITFLRNLIKIGRFTFRVQKFNSLFSLVTERDFVISQFFSCLSQNFPQPSVLGAIMKENLVLNFPLQRLDATRRHFAFPSSSGYSASYSVSYSDAWRHFFHLRHIPMLRWLDPVILWGYHPTLKLSGIPTFTLIISLTYRSIYRSKCHVVIVPRLFGVWVEILLLPALFRENLSATYSSR